MSLPQSDAPPPRRPELGPWDRGWTVHTEVFEGPLDLLLYLVKRDGIDLRALPIAKVCDAYLGYLEQMRRVNLDIASEYLVMAATLCHLKSLELLPRPPQPIEEDGPDPRETFQQQLEAYARARQGAQLLDERPVRGRDVFTRSPMSTEHVVRELDPTVDAFGLLEVYYAVLVRAAEPEPVVSIEESGPDFSTCARRVFGWLRGMGGSGVLDDLLASLPRRVDRLLSFLAVLEMGRLGWLQVRQAAHLGPVRILASISPDEVDFNALSTWVERENEQAGELEPGR